MISLLLSAAAPFVAGVVDDPIYRTKTAIFGTMDDGSALAVVCSSHGVIDVRISPRGYTGFAPGFGVIGPRADGRFSRADKPTGDAWTFAPTYLQFDDSKLGGVKRKAHFLDQLARDDTFSLRYEALPGDVRTVTIHYAIDAKELGKFVRQCGAKRVSAYLRAWESPAAPSVSGR